MAIMTKTEIQQATVARGKDKATGLTFYVVKSDSSDTWHHITWDNRAIAWRCDGESCQYQSGGTTCKHTRAVLDVLRVRRQAMATAMGPGAVETVKRWQAEEDAKQAAREALPLNGNRGFSLLR